MRQLLAVALLIGAAGCGSPTQPSPVTSLNGVYLLTIDSSCPALPAELRRRTFFATIQGTNVTLSGSPFFWHPTRGLLNWMSIAVNGQSVTVRLETSAGLEILGIIDEPSPGQYWKIVGTGTGTIAPAPSTVPTIEGTLAVQVRAGADVSLFEQSVGCESGVPVTFRFQPSMTSAPAPHGGTPTVTKLSLSGPASVAPGATAQFAALATFSDGSSRDVTGDAAWFMPDTTSGIAALVGSGLVQGRSIGEATLRATSSVPNTGDPSSVVDVIVTPSGTVRIAGFVTTAGSFAPVAGAEVAVTSGQAMGLTTSTNWEGRYALFGIAGPTTFSVSKAGYGTEHRSVGGTTHEVLNVGLTPGALASVAGTYTVTMEADPACRAALPEPARLRTYQAALTQNVARVSFKLSGASFVVDEFEGSAEPNEVRFVLVDYWGYYWNGTPFPSVVETVSSNPWIQLVPSGRARLSVTPDGLAGELAGAIETFDRDIVCCPFLPWTAPAPAATCRGTHPLRMLKR
jgi:hypothetical protein